MKTMKLADIRLKPYIYTLMIENTKTGDRSGSFTVALPHGFPLLAVDKFSTLLSMGFKLEEDK